MDTGAPSPAHRTSLKGSRGGQSPRRASFGGEVARRPIRKAFSAATTATGGAGPLPRRQLDPRLFKSVSMQWTPPSGPASKEQTLVQRGSSRAPRSGALVDAGDLGVLFEDSTDSRNGGGGESGVDSGGRDGAELDDGSDGVDQSVIHSSGDSPGQQSAGANQLDAATADAPPSRASVGSIRKRWVAAGSIQKPSSSSTAIAAIAAARRVRLLRGSPPGTMPVPLPRSLSSAGTGTAMFSSPSTSAWERNRRTASARVARMLADADAAETAATAVASQSQAHSRAAAAAEAAAASVRAQAAAEEAELAAQAPGLRNIPHPQAAVPPPQVISARPVSPRSEASLAPGGQTSQSSTGKRRQVDPQPSSAVGGLQAAPTPLFQTIGQSQQQPQRADFGARQTQPIQEPSPSKRRARDGGFSLGDLSQAASANGGRSPSQLACGFEGGDPSAQSGGRSGPHVASPFSAAASVAPNSRAPRMATFSAGRAGVESRLGSLPTPPVGAPSLTPTSTLLPPNGVAPAEGRPSPSQLTSAPASLAFGAPTARGGVGNGGAGLGGGSSFFAPQAEKGPSSGPAGVSGGGLGGGVFGEGGFGGGAFGGGGFGGGGLASDGANRVGAVLPGGARASSSGGAAPSPLAINGGAAGGLKRSSSQLGLEAAAGGNGGGGGDSGTPKALAALGGFGGVSSSPFGGNAPPPIPSRQGGGVEAFGAAAPPTLFAPPPAGPGGGGFGAAPPAAAAVPLPAVPPAPPFTAPSGGGGGGAGAPLGAPASPFSFGLPSPRLL